jgi:CheY-like chemotaxis protein
VRALLVEDSAPLARAIKRALEARGFTVVRAVDGVSARETLEGGGAFDVVVSDVAMPRLDGLGLLRWIREHRSDLVSRCVFMTGDMGAPPGSEIARTHVNPVLPKPVEMESLFALLDRIVAGGVASA